MSSFKEQIREWIHARNPRISADAIAYDTPLLENKILTSIQIMDLILFLEHLQQRPVDIDQVQPENFLSIDTIHAAFFEHAEGNAA